MKIKTRFIKSIVDASKDAEVAMPWQRGARRNAFVEKRKAPPLHLKRA